MSRGALMALEGIDGAGTTTQARLLVDWLDREGRAAHLTCEPTDGPVGRLIRQVLHHAHGAVHPAVTALLFAADRVDHMEREMAPLLASGVHVVTDRYVYSSMVYQGLDLDPGWVTLINQLAVEPGLVIYLRTPPAEALQRRTRRGGPAELFETEQLQRRVATAYDQIFGDTVAAGSWVLDEAAGRWGRRRPGIAGGATPRCWAVLDGTLSVEEIQGQIRSLVVAHLTVGEDNGAQRQDLGRNDNQL